MKYSETEANNETQNTNTKTHYSNLNTTVML